MVTLENLITDAKNIVYIEPTTDNIDQYSNDELVYKSINIALNNEVQIKAGLYICSLFPPLKLVYKSILRGYIVYFTPK